MQSKQCPWSQICRVITTPITQPVMTAIYAPYNTHSSISRKINSNNNNSKTNKTNNNNSHNDKTKQGKTIHLFPAIPQQYPKIKKINKHFPTNPPHHFNKIILPNFKRIKPKTIHFPIKLDIRIY